MEKFETYIGIFKSEQACKTSIIRMLAALALRNEIETEDFIKYHKAYEDIFEEEIECDRLSNSRVRFYTATNSFDVTRSQIYKGKKISYRKPDSSYSYL